MTGGALLLYGALFETGKLRRERKTLELSGWPSSHGGYRIGLVADSHIRDAETVALTRSALEFLVEEKPDMIAFAGDLIAYWKPGVEDLVREALAPLTPVP